MREAHEILGVAVDADAIEIRAAYVTRLRTAHPDTGGAGGEPISEIVRAYRALRAAALRKRRNGIGSISVVPIAMRSRRGMEPPVPRPSRAAWWGRGASLAVLFLAIGAAVYASSRLPSAVSPLRVDAGTATGAQSRGPLWSDVDAVDEDVLRDAVAAVRSFTANEGAAGLEEHSRRCFAVLTQSPNFHLLDYCLAFDSAATSSMGGGSAGRTGTEPFFHPGTMSQRHDAALQLLLPDREAAQARHSEVEAKAVSELMRATRI
ncbi:MAG TPA: J domain-containing protein [Allosphingosinicella sp.]|nr:J domain-containing protein [Allosphingosinicella sp.]